MSFDQMRLNAAITRTAIRVIGRCGDIASTSRDMTRIGTILLLLFLLVVPTVGQNRRAKKATRSPRSDRSGTLYERVAAKLSANPELAERLGRPPAELEQLAWLVGRWRVTAHVFATAHTPERTEEGEAVVERVLDGAWLSLRDTYPGGTQDQGFLTYNVATRRWTSLSIDSTGNAIVATSAGWSADRMVYVAPDVEILGERVTLRQTLERRSDTEYRVLNEERLRTGKWQALDEYVYVKIAASN